jgi:hypothetical protein
MMGSASTVVRDAVATVIAGSLPQFMLQCNN